MIVALVLVIAAYLIGSIPFSLLLVRWVRGIDLRDFGSGNIGATNARRAAGTGWGIVALLADIAKGSLPVLGVLLCIAMDWIGDSGWIRLAVGVAAIFGHIFPVYLRFKPSGKGVATTLGCFLVLTPMAAGIMVIVLITVVTLFRRMSAGSMAGVVSLPLSIWLIYQDPLAVGCALMVMVVVIIRHKDNIQRLRRGVEPKLGQTN